MPALILKPEREKSLLRRHPWIFSGAVERLTGDPRPGETVDVRDWRGQWLARAAYSPSSQIRARVWTFDPEETVDAAFFRRRIQAAIERRRLFGFSLAASAETARPAPEWHGAAGEDASLATSDMAAHAGRLAAGSLRTAQPIPTNAFRLVHAESDGLPGLVADWYDGVIVAQFLTAGSEFWRDTLAVLLMELTGAFAVYERSDADVRELEGLPPRTGLLRGMLSAPVVGVQEYGLRFRVNLETGHKTGFYLDQRANRRRVGELAHGRDVLNCFSYTGGFTLHAAAGRAQSVLSVDTSAEALALGRENAHLNRLPTDRLDWLEADVFTALRKFRDQNRSWDLIVLDPPKFAPTAAQAQKAARGYKDINRLAFKLLRPGGLLVTFSCSGGIDAALFQKIVASAALDAGVEAQIVEHLAQGPDHPVSLHFPEGAYLKGLVCLKVH